MRGISNKNQNLSKENKLSINSNLFLLSFDFICLFHVLTYITGYVISSVPDSVHLVISCYHWIRIPYLALIVNGWI